MTSPRNISIYDFTYLLPEDRIAKYPLADRDASRLLIYKNGIIAEDVYKNISGHLPANSLLVFNNTRVVEARLLFQKQSGGIIEIFCLQPHEQYTDVTTAMLQTNKVLWQCLVGGASKWKHGQILEKKITATGKSIILQARYVEKKTAHFVIELSWSPASMSFAEVLHHTGAIPLPPYIKRAVESSDAERYQTVYAHFDGSVAAPTAGLHFTESIFQKLEAKQVKKEFVTLHVGAGTFKPVKTGTMNTHEMHAEFIDVSKTSIENILHHLDHKIITIGTTSLRTVETLYWLGVKQSGAGSREPGTDQTILELSQWECYEMVEQDMPAAQALSNLLSWMNKNHLERLVARTKIIIAPGYRLRMADALVTNFHQPQSTLLLLVAALIGEKWKDVYDYALAHDLRFLSYGDGSLLWADCIRSSSTVVRS